MAARCGGLHATDKKVSTRVKSQQERAVVDPDVLVEVNRIQVIRARRPTDVAARRGGEERSWMRAERCDATLWTSSGC